MFIRKKIFYLLIIEFLSIINGVISENLRALIFSRNETVYSNLVNSFNEYSKEKQLNITLDYELLSSRNSTVSRGNFITIIDSLLTKKSKKYDLYFYFDVYNNDYGKHFEDLTRWIPKERIEKFDSGVILNSCTYKNKIYSLPIMIYISILYSNKSLLSKYGKEIPKTWDELIETGKFIWNEERTKNNKNYIIYNGIFDDTDFGIFSIYEMMNSFRDSNNSTVPKITDEKMKDALMMMKKIKNEIGNDYIFRLDNSFSTRYLWEENAIFVKQLYRAHSPIYEISPLPGYKEGVSGSITDSYNIAISRYITENKKKAAAEVILYVTSEKVQKEHIIDASYLSGRMDFYNDKEICSNMNCDFISNIRPFSCVKFYDTKPYDVNDYAILFRNLIYDYLYGNKPLQELINDIDDLTKIYELTVDTNDSSVGLIILIVFILIFFIIVLSIPFIYMKLFDYNLRKFSKNFWLLSIIGSLLILCSVLTLYGKVTTFKCNLRVVMINYGMLFSFYTILYYLIIHFPIENDLIIWVSQHKNFYMMGIIAISSVLNILLLVSPREIKKISFTGNKNYEKCGLYQSYGTVIAIINIFCCFVSLIFTLLITLFEWNIEELKNDIKFFFATLLMIGFFLTLYIIFELITINNYISYNLIIAVLIIYSFSSYMFTYGIMIIIKLLINIFSSVEGEISSKNEESIIKNMFSYISTFDYSKNTFMTNNNEECKKNYKTVDITDLSIQE